MNIIYYNSNKDNNEESGPEKKFIRYGDVIREKIKENKKEDRILRNFEELEEMRDEWGKTRNVKLNAEKDKQIKIENKNPKNEENKLNSEEIKITSKIENTSNIIEKNQILEKSQTENNLGIISTILEKVNDFDLKVSTKEFKVTVDPKEVIEEQSEQNETKRTINHDKFSADYKCLELYNWFHLMFQEWEKELDRLPFEVKLNGEGREKLGIYKQCRGYIKPLLKLLKRKEVTKEIMNKLFEVMTFCIDRDYIRAHDSYIELAIGNAPWPMGVTMVGIHERSGRSKIYKSQVAHILNDENTKKYLQSVKRIMSLVQRLYHTSPSNQVVS